MPSSAICCAPLLAGSGGFAVAEPPEERCLCVLVVGGVFVGAVAEAALGDTEGRADAAALEGFAGGRLSTTTIAPPAAHTALTHSAAVFAPMLLSSVAPPPPAAVPALPTAAPPLALSRMSPRSAPMMPPPAPTALASNAGAGTTTVSPRKDRT
jgi:hypothetical protein